MDLLDHQEINGYDLRLTCGGRPEQYDVYAGQEKVGYLRLRHGGFTVDVPECGGETIYDADPDGDGNFEDYEREYFLTKAVLAIDSHIRNKPKT